MQGMLVICGWLMTPPSPSRNDWKFTHWILSPLFALGGLAVLMWWHQSGKSEANLADGTLRWREYRAFFRIRSDEKATELSRLARAAGYQPPPDVWVNCKSYTSYGPYKERGNGSDMLAYNAIIHAGGVASLAKDRGQPKSLQWFHSVFALLQRREYLKLSRVLDKDLTALVSEKPEHR
jgi:hypothetical protein